MSAPCEQKRLHGSDHCVLHCPLAESPGLFSYARVERPGQEPPFDSKLVDVALLDMNCGYPNLGHDSLVSVVKGVACDLAEPLRAAGLGIRVLSYDVRRSGLLPAPPGPRFRLYLGTGGPGHLDPRSNDGNDPLSQGVIEDPAWEGPLFDLFAAIRREEEASLFGVCHTFGLLCRWSGAAAAVERGVDKGGKSTGVLENLLTDEAVEHPWFSRLAAAIPERRRLRVLDSRYFDLIPYALPLPGGAVPLAYEAVALRGPRGDSLTMMELARDRGGVMPRMLGVNHHAEILERPSLILLLRQKLAAGEVTFDWYDERVRILTTRYPGEDSERLLAITSHFTLVAPLRFHLTRIARERAPSLAAHEDALLA